jgi:hydrogenase 3 maturation protease
MEVLFKRIEDVMVIDGGTVPENFTGLIKKETPSHIILMDAADMGKPQGSIKIIQPSEISQYHLSTHAMPLSFLIKYLKESTKADIILIGVQPKDMELVDTLSEEVTNSIKLVIEIFQKLLNSPHHRIN